MCKNAKLHYTFFIYPKQILGKEILIEFSILIVYVNHSEISFPIWIITL